MKLDKTTLTCLDRRYIKAVCDQGLVEYIRVIKDCVIYDLSIKKERYIFYRGVYVTRLDAYDYELRNNKVVILRNYLIDRYSYRQFKRAYDKYIKLLGGL